MLKYKWLKEIMSDGGEFLILVSPIHRSNSLCNILVLLIFMARRTGRR